MCIIFTLSFFFQSLFASGDEILAAPKRLKFEHKGSSEKGLNTVDDEGKGAIKFSLVAADRPLVEKTTEFNDQKLGEFKLYGPEFKVVSCKKIGSVFSPNTGLVEFRFRTFPFNWGQGKTTTLTLDSHQFLELVHISHTILRCIYSVEGRVEHPLNPGPTEISKILHWEDRKDVSYNQFRDTHVCKLPLIDDYFVDFVWNEKTKESFVYIYKGKENSSDNRAPADNKFLLCGGGFEVFAREIIPKLRNSLRYWGNVYKAGKEVWDSLYSQYEPKSEYFTWNKHFGWWMPVEDEDLHGDYEEKEKLPGGSLEGSWKIFDEEDGRSYYAN